MDRIRGRRSRLSHLGGRVLEPGRGARSRAQEALLAPTITLQTPKGNGLVISDVPGEGILIQSASGAKISITDDGITIDNGKQAVITLKANKVDVNNGALSIE